MVPADRLRPLNPRPERADGAYVLYWMVAHRRPFHNFALQHAVERAVALGKPLLIVEWLGLGHPWAGDRFHRFMLEGMVDHMAHFATTTATYRPWIETVTTRRGEALDRLFVTAAAIVTDDWPCFIHPGLIADAAQRAPVAMTAVDSNSLLPLSQAALKERAVDFRRHLQKTLAPHLDRFPVADPLRGVRLPPLAQVPLPVQDPAAFLAPGGLAALPIDHTVGAGVDRGGFRAAATCLARFRAERLARYHEDRSDVEAEAASGLAPWLHYGHISVHEIVATLLQAEDWSPARLGAVTASKEGWWGTSPALESFLDELVTWRELGHAYCRLQPRYDQWDTLPAWARATLEAHAADVRPRVYTRAQLDAAETHDPLWNAAQRQLVTEGRMHNYLRMLWGTKVLEWSRTPQEAFDTLIHLNNRYAQDGCDPNSYSGIAWCFGRFDRPWAPMRPIFGSIRYMSSDNTARKFRVKGYLARYGAVHTPSLLDP
jgi:deoxyribodipyrimidine photo-lyase